MNLLAEENKQRNDCKSYRNDDCISCCKVFYCFVVLSVVQSESLEYRIDCMEKVYSQNYQRQQVNERVHLVFEQVVAHHIEVGFVIGEVFACKALQFLLSPEVDYLFAVFGQLVGRLTALSKLQIWHILHLKVHHHFLSLLLVNLTALHLLLNVQHLVGDVHLQLFCLYSINAFDQTKLCKVEVYEVKYQKGKNQAPGSNYILRVKVSFCL